MKKIYISLLAIVLINISFTTKAQDTIQVQNINVGADLVSSYIWRGLVFCDKPSIQPYISYTNNKGNFTIGTWGSLSNDGSYNEVDFWATYVWNNLSVSIWDYNTVNSGINYFEYDNKKTTHLIEGIVAYKISESIPLTITAGSFLYGADKKPNDTTLTNNYSSYFELSYPIKWKSNEVNLFVGATPTDGKIYGMKDFGIVNAGLSTTKQIKFSEDFSMGVSGSLITNPMAEKIYFVLALKF